jgi:hypothetical protein
VLQFLKRNFVQLAPRSGLFAHLALKKYSVSSKNPELVVDFPEKMD